MVIVGCATEAQYIKIKIERDKNLRDSWDKFIVKQEAKHGKKSV